MYFGEFNLYHYYFVEVPSSYHFDNSMNENICVYNTFNESVHVKIEQAQFLLRQSLCMTIGFKVHLKQPLSPFVRNLPLMSALLLAAAYMYSSNQNKCANSKNSFYEFCLIKRTTIYFFCHTYI